MILILYYCMTIKGYNPTTILPIHYHRLNESNKCAQSYVNTQDYLPSMYGHLKFVPFFNSATLTNGVTCRT